MWLKRRISHQRRAAEIWSRPRLIQGWWTLHDIKKKNDSKQQQINMNASVDHYFLVTKSNSMSVPSVGSSSITKLKRSAVKYLCWRSAWKANSNLLIRAMDLLLDVGRNLPSHIHHPWASQKPRPWHRGCVLGVKVRHAAAAQRGPERKRASQRRQSGVAWCLNPWLTDSDLALRSATSESVPASSFYQTRFFWLFGKQFESERPSQTPDSDFLELKRLFD